jgi:hypothetical protein
MNIWKQVCEGEALAQQVQAAAALPDAELEKVRLPGNAKKCNSRK